MYNEDKRDDWKMKCTLKRYSKFFSAVLAKPAVMMKIKNVYAGIFSTQKIAFYK